MDCKESLSKGNPAREQTSPLVYRSGETATEAGALGWNREESVRRSAVTYV